MTDKSSLGFRPGGDAQRRRLPWGLALALWILGSLLAWAAVIAPWLQF